MRSLRVPCFAMGVTQFDRHEFRDAERYFLQAVARDPTRSEYHGNLGCAVRAQGRFGEALKCFETAVELDPTSALACFNLGNLQAFLRLLDAARHSLTKACRLDPGNARFHFERALLLLRQGEFEEGWREYEWRPGAHRLRGDIENSDGTVHAPWRLQDLGGKRIVVHAEQGFGDTIQFFRYVEILVRCGAAVTLECQSVSRAY